MRIIYETFRLDQGEAESIITYYDDAYNVSWIENGKILRFWSEDGIKEVPRERVVEKTGELPEGVVNDD